jgi:hypothetical protein
MNKSVSIFREITQPQKKRTFDLNGKICVSFTMNPMIGNENGRVVKMKNKSYEIYPYIVFKNKVRGAGYADYIRSTLAQLYFNNNVYFIAGAMKEPYITWEEAKELLITWILRWRENAPLLNNKKIVKIIDNEYEHIVSAFDSIENLILWKRSTLYWYSFNVESTEDRNDRKELKNRLRQELNADDYRDALETSSDEYQERFWGAMPTRKHLEVDTEFCRQTVNRYGTGLYVTKALNTQMLVDGARNLHGGLTQVATAKLISMHQENDSDYFDDGDKTALGLSTVKG